MTGLTMAFSLLQTAFHVELVQGKVPFFKIEGGRDEERD